MRVVFAGTPEFARVALAHLIEAGFEVPLVLCQPDRPAGRGMKLQACAVKQLALAHGIRVEQPQKLKWNSSQVLEVQHQKALDAQQALLKAEADAMVVAAYGLILPKWVLDTPRLGCFNIHASVLPRWRGAAPIHRAIEAGDATTGVTIMQMDEGLDTGDMLAVQTLPIEAQDTTASLHDKLAELGGQMMVNVLQQAKNGELRPQPQPELGVSYAHKIDKAESRLNWHEPICTLERRIRAFEPFPGINFDSGACLIRVCSSQIVSHVRPENMPGTILKADDQGVDVCCSDGVLRITQLQRPGAKRLLAGEFLRGFPLKVGQILG